MRYIKYLCIAAFAVVLITIALGNRDFVQLQLLPDVVAGLFGLNPKISLPMFVVVYGGILAGILVGFVWEWLREFGHRRHEAQLERETRRLQREVKKLKGEKHEGKDEVLALLDEAV